MSNINPSTKLIFKPLIKLSLTNIFIIIIICFNIIYVQSSEGDYDSESELNCHDYSSNYEQFFCFDKPLIFNNSKYLAGNFAMNKNGDFIIGFSEDDEETYSKLFYGLKNDGRNYFPNDSSTHEIKLEKNYLDDTGYYDYYKIYKSTSLFISLKNDNKKKNQYLFSINSYNSIVELHDLNNINSNKNNHLIWNFNDFFNLDEDFYIFPYEYSLYELEKESTYIIIFTPLINITEDMKNIDFIKKFTFKSFDAEAYEELYSVNYTDYIGLYR